MLRAETEHKTSWRWSDGELLMPWLLGQTVAGLLAWGIGALLILFSRGMANFGLGTLMGLCLGTAQALVLRRAFGDEILPEWIWASIAGGSLGWLIITARQIGASWLNGWDQPVVGLLVLGGAGAVVGWGQSIPLRRNVRLAAWWIVANIVGWTLGGSVGKILGDTLYTAIASDPVYQFERPWLQSAIAFDVMGTVGTITCAIFTGCTLIWLLRRTATQNELAT
jgi:hypothetical protein